MAFDWGSIPSSVTNAGFTVRLFEWWDERAGFIYRSARLDHRNTNGALGFTSLLIDAVKPR